MTLHIFNPEHDIALAANLDIFTAPHAGRQLRHDLAFLPALWAAEGDVLLVDDVEVAQKGLLRLSHKCSPLSGFRAEVDVLPRRLQLVEARQLASTPVNAVNPWGWDRALRALLQRKGIDSSLLPSSEQLDAIRQLSHRREAAALLAALHEQLADWQTSLVGEAVECHEEGEVEALLARWPQVVMKAPWSSSGRGLRFASDLQPHRGWLRNLLERQGSVMVEPYYNKVKDFGMEFASDGQGGVTFLGLSLFHTANGAYTGNLLMTEAAKRQQLSRYLPLPLLDAVQQTVCSQLSTTIGQSYCGPFGIDMMIIANPRSLTTNTHHPSPNTLLHPCVEINLRRTMGHAALSLTPLVNPEADDELVRVMRIVYEDNNYKLKIQRL